jgi:Mrp family chromosome partitioning ATPase
VSNIPYFPKKTPITLIAALGTFCLATAFVVTSALLNGENYGAARRATDVVVESEPVIVPEPVVARAPATVPEPVIAPKPVVVPEPAPAPDERSVDAPIRADDRPPATTATWPEPEAPALSEHAAPVLSEPEPPMFREPVMPAFPQREAAVSPKPERRPFDEAPMRAVPEARGIHEARDIDEEILGDLDTPEARAILERTAPSFPKPAAPPLVPESAPQPANTRVDDIATALRRAGAEGRSVAVIGSARNVGTTVTSIALARALARTDRVVLVDLAFSSAHVDPLAEDSNGPGVAELLRGEASFGDVIIRDPGSRAHLVTAGRVGGSAHELLESDLLWDAVEALAQSYDYLVIDAGVQSEIAPAHFAMTTPYAVLVCGDTPVVAITALAGELQQAGFVHVAIMSGSPPSLEEAAAQTAA